MTESLVNSAETTPENDQGRVSPALIISCGQPAKSGLFVTTQLRPSINHGIRIQGDRRNPLIHQPFSQIRVIGRALAADADVLTHLVGSGNRHRQQHLDGWIALEIEAFGLMKMT